MRSTMPAFSFSILLSSSANICAEASRFGLNRTRRRVPSANRTSAAHLAAGFRHFVPSSVSG
ncbi:MAG: hypothetical protein K2X82_26840 [Gemmataceae bacterium]|nr:hypothetical protein [Gemmataceae bacterium]